MRDAGTVEQLLESQIVKRLTEADGWRKRCNQWGGRGFLTTIVTHDNFDMPYDRAEEELFYALKLGEILGVLEEKVREEEKHRDF